MIIFFLKGNFFREKCNKFGERGSLLVNDMMRMSDRQVVEKVLRGDRECYSCVVRRYSSVVYATALNLTKRREEAIELTQRTFVRAYERLAYFRSENLKNWLLAITYHLSVDFLKHEQAHRTVAVEAVADIEETPYSAEHEYRLQLMERAIAALPTDDRDIIRMHYFLQLSTKEIAEQKKLSQNNVLVRLHRIRERLRNQLEKQNI